MDNKTAVGLLTSLAQESRLSLFRLLVQAGPSGLAAGSIAEQLGVPASTLSFHLKELSHARLVQARQDGRFIYYSADFSVMNALLGFLLENCCGGQQDCCSPIIVTSKGSPS
ncbi:MAG TPA: metalloregulator ArsR/SmtB family transcription factor [Methylophilaceae bacterium]|nr:metalloregulator ArsR/SmtB family transcription factor [Methylophilaceae bacterium]